MEVPDVVATGQGRWSRLWRAFVGAPAYPATAADRATVGVFGLELPFRSSVAIVVMVFAILADFHRNFLPADLLYARDAGAMRTVALERLVLFGLFPLTTVLLVFRDDPRRYGLRIGDWRAGIVLVAAGLVVMVPIVIWFGHQPDFVAYYAPMATDPANVVLTNVIDLFSAEFLFRGFLMFTLVRYMGPLGVIVAAVPFTFSHLGKPELETLSTLFGGSVFGWLAWRTGSILYSATAHVVILSLITLAAAGTI
ncbi:MAG TPA: CPBP family intramembrane glutamic endopeptidase [Candidatus Binatia bacterium]|nr:CPBP family intramembrane glutamic endopeptidase [Candidatus Binatia bacterium]